MESQNTIIKKGLSLKTKTIFAIIGGVLAGLVNGLFGGGGGMIIVPLLTLILGYEAKHAHATAILIILPLSLLSGLLYAYFGNLNGSIAFPVSIGVTLGGITGALILSKLSSKWLTIIFSAVMVVAGFKMMLF